MGLLDALFGHNDQPEQQEQRTPQQNAPQQPQQRRLQNADEQALARYRYMLQTAPPEDLERAHEEGFAKLTPEQRQMVLQQMSQMIPESEARGLSDDPRALARAATRAEINQPGAMERMFGGANNIGGVGAMGSGVMGGMGGLLAGSLLASLAGSLIGGSIANSFFSNPAHEAAFQNSPEVQNLSDGVSDYNAGDFQETGLNASADPYGDPANLTQGDYQQTGYGASSDPYGDPGAGGLDTADYGGSDFGGDIGGDL